LKLTKIEKIEMGKKCTKKITPINFKKFQLIDNYKMQLFSFRLFLVSRKFSG